MNYETTEALFYHMDNLETNSKMYSNEIYNANPDWEAINRYDDNIKTARKGIFKILQDQQNV
jgi:hypothetical protein